MVIWAIASFFVVNSLNEFVVSQIETPMIDILCSRSYVKKTDELIDLWPKDFISRTSSYRRTTILYKLPTGVPCKRAWQT